MTEPQIIKLNNKGSYQKVWFNDKKLYHRIDGPAIIKYFDDGTLHYVQYFLNGVRYNPKGPSYIYFYEKKNILSYSKYISYTNVNGQPHREDGPAEIWFDKNNNIATYMYYYHNMKINSLKELLFKAKHAILE